MKKNLKYLKLFEAFNTNVIDVSNKIDIDLLMTIKDERNILKEGDIVLATYCTGDCITYEFKLEYDNEIGLCVSDGNTLYVIDEAYHIVRKSSYIFTRQINLN